MSNLLDGISLEQFLEYSQVLYSHVCATLCGFSLSKCLQQLRIVVYTTLSRELRVQGRARVSNIDSAVAGTAYVVCTEPFILWLPRLQHSSVLISTVCGVFPK